MPIKIHNILIWEKKILNILFWTIWDGLDQSEPQLHMDSMRLLRMIHLILLIPKIRSVELDEYCQAGRIRAEILPIKIKSFTLALFHLCIVVHFVFLKNDLWLVADSTRAEYDTKIIETKRNNKFSSPITMYGHREWNRQTYAKIWPICSGRASELGIDIFSEPL